jgi:6-phosphogluconolactonase
LGAFAREVRILPDAQAVSHMAATEFLRRATASVTAAGKFTVHVFWGDERHVPPSHEASNYRMANEAMLSKLPLPPENIHRIRTEVPSAEEAARLYEEELRQTFQLAPGQLPRIDLVFLGMGPDGHTASLFPGTDVLHERVRLVASLWVEKFKSFRITLTPVVLNNAACVVFLVVGEDKAEALREVLEGDAPADCYPAKLIRPSNGMLLWLVDRAAARGLSAP